MAEGTVFKALSGFYYVEHGEAMVECKARGRFRIEKETPLVGDRVEFIETEQGRGYVTSISHRKNSFVRPPVANIDKMVLVVSAAEPATGTSLIDMMAAVAYKNNSEPVICINKCDLDPGNELYGIYSSAGFETIRTSAKTGAGLGQLCGSIKGTMCVFTGNSGVGKSSMLNKLDPAFSITTGEISAKLGRGRHTTRHVQLYRIPCGAIIADTPGFSSYEMFEDIAKEELAGLFPDFSPFMDKCRFIDCSHINEPDCAVVRAVEEGSLQISRHRSYEMMYRRASLRKQWDR